MPTGATCKGRKARHYNRHPDWLALKCSNHATVCNGKMATLPAGRHVTHPNRPTGWHGGGAAHELAPGGATAQHTQQLTGWRSACQTPWPARRQATQQLQEHASWQGACQANVAIVATGQTASHSITWAGRAPSREKHGHRGPRHSSHLLSCARVGRVHSRRSWPSWSQGISAQHWLALCCAAPTEKCEPTGPKKEDRPQGQNPPPQAVYTNHAGRHGPHRSNKVQTAAIKAWHAGFRSL